MEDLDQEFLNWLAGFIDGEGSFVIGFYRTSKSRYGIWPNTGISISQSEPNDWILDYIREKIGVGASVKTRPPWRGFEDNFNRRPQKIIRFSGWRLCAKIGKMVLPYLKVKKRQCELMLEVCRHSITRHTFTKDDMIRIAEARDELTKGRRNDPRYITAEKLREHLAKYPDYGLPKTRWSVEDDEKLRELYGKLDAEETAKHLGRSNSSIWHRANRIGVLKYHPQDLLDQEVISCPRCGHRWYVQSENRDKRCPECKKRFVIKAKNISLCKEIGKISKLAQGATLNDQGVSMPKNVEVGRFVIGNEGTKVEWKV